VYEVDRVGNMFLDRIDRVVSQIPDRKPTIGASTQRLTTLDQAPGSAMTDYRQPRGAPPATIGA
jgi:hypothetical protein